MTRNSVRLQAQNSGLVRPVHRIALAGNPNSGKTTLFNALTGLHQKVANYPGVTVEHQTGLWSGTDCDYHITDLPGSYSLLPRSPDEAIASDWLSGCGKEPRPDAVICVADVTNLARHLYLVGQIIDLGIPTVLALTMGDEAERIGLSVDTARLSAHLSVPVVGVIAPQGRGLGELELAVRGVLAEPWETPPRGYLLPPAFENRLKEYAPKAGASDRQALFCVCGQHTGACTDSLEKVASQVRSELGIDEETARRFVVEARFNWHREICRDVEKRTGTARSGWTRRLDDLLLNRYLGPVFLTAALAIMFQAIFKWAEWPMGAIETVTGEWLPGLAGRVLAPGPLLSLVNDGIFAGVGSVVVFLPQILLLFLFLSILEDTGYLARAAFILDRIMSRVGLSGRSFIPLLSSFACAIPGIMAARTIPHRRDRLATILVAPLMTCSARLVIYTLLIAAFVPDQKLWGPFGLQGASLLGLYLVGIVGAALVAAIFRHTILRGPTPPLLMELPPYRRPRLRSTVLTLLQRAKTFLVSAGTIIFAASIVLWGLSSYPRWSHIEENYGARRAAVLGLMAPADQEVEMAKLDQEFAAERLQHSFAGYIGRAMEPLIAPLGFDWKIGIGILGSFAAREVFVSTMGVVYGVGSTDDGAALVDKLRADRDPATGRPIWTPLVALSLLIFYAFALQCISTVAVIKRETNSWRWPAFAFAYTGLLAYGAAFLTRQIGLWLS